jgi:hypothetical protein
LHRAPSWKQQGHPLVLLPRRNDEFKSGVKKRNSNLLLGCDLLLHCIDLLAEAIRLEVHLKYNQYMCCIKHQIEFLAIALADHEKKTHSSPTLRTLL